MKKPFAFFSALFCVCAALAQGGAINFKTVPISMVLNVYSDLSGKQLVIDSAVTNQTRLITVTSSESLNREQAAKLIESALKKQAGVVIEPIDDKRLAVKLEKKK